MSRTAMNVWIALLMAFASLLVARVAVAQGGAAVKASSHVRLLPPTTRGMVTIPDAIDFRDKFKQTGLGRMLNDDLMDPFVKDLRKQFNDRLDEEGIQLGITIEELRGVASGEMTFARLQPGDDKTRHAALVLVEVGENREKAQSLLAKAERKLVERGGTKSGVVIAGQTLTRVQLPRRKSRRLNDLLLFGLVDSLLVASDDPETLDFVLGRLDGDQTDGSLAASGAYNEILSRTQLVGEPDAAPDLLWYAEPFGLAEIFRASGPRRRGKNLIKIFQDQGFAAVQAAGGQVALFPTPEHEVQHRSFIYAPVVPDLGEQRYEKAARMLDFPTVKESAPPKWLPEELVGYASFQWRLQEAFDAVEPLVDEFADDPGLFDDVLESIEKDETGPRVNLRTELVEHLGERVIMATDYQLPITTKSERLLVALRLKDAAGTIATAKTVEKVMLHDVKAGRAKRIKFGKHVIWEIVNEAQGGPGLPQVDGPGLDIFGDQEADEEDEPLLPNSAVAVVPPREGDGPGWLIVASHVDFITKILQTAADDSLGQTEDFQRIEQALLQLGGTEISAKTFSRLDEDLRPTYELVRQGKMPEAETLLGRALNAALGNNEEDVLRKQEVDGSKLPDYNKVRDYLGPSGVYFQQTNSGWLAVGAILPNKAPRVAVAAQPDDESTETK